MKNIIFGLFFLFLISGQGLALESVFIKDLPAPNGPVSKIVAQFHFRATEQNPSVPSGRYTMAGTFDSDSKVLELKGVSWVERPENYEMVPLKGKISSDGSKFIGRIQFDGCKEFTLIRVARGGRSPIGGKWEGGYVCSQGVTGLTLTLD